MTSPTPPRSLCDQEDMEECASDRGPPCVPIVHRRWRVSQRFAPAMVYEPKKVAPPVLARAMCSIGTEDFIFVVFGASVPPLSSSPRHCFADFGHLNCGPSVAMR